MFNYNVEIYSEENMNVHGTSVYNSVHLDEKFQIQLAQKKINLPNSKLPHTKHSKSMINQKYFDIFSKISVFPNLQVS